jgi:hypothetical protein
MGANLGCVSVNPLKGVHVSIQNTTDLDYLKKKNRITTL